MHPAGRFREEHFDNVKLTLFGSTVVDGVQRKAGEAIDVGDWRLAGALLKSGMAEPADSEERASWRASRQAQTKGWITGWREQ